MSGLTLSIYATAFALCFFSAGVFSGQRTRAGRPLGFFSAYLSLEALGFVFEVLMLHPATPLKAVWLGLRMITSLLVAPCLWLAMREIVEGERPRLRGIPAGHYAVIALGALLTLPLIATAHLGATYHDPGRPSPPEYPNLVHSTMLLCLIIFALQVPYYLWRCRRLLVGQLREAENAGQTRTAGDAAWLHLPLAIVFSAWAVGVLRTSLGAAGATQPGHLLLFAVIQVTVTIAAIYLVVRRALSFNSETAMASVAPASAPLEGTKTTASPYARTSLDAATRERIRRKIEHAFAVDTIYTDSLVSLRSLSSSIKEKSHYVSQVINQDLGTTFYELLNRHRIDRAKLLLIEAPQQSVLEIALAVGFNSKSTFNAAFRRHTGITPTEFRSAN